MGENLKLWTLSTTGVPDYNTTDLGNGTSPNNFTGYHFHQTAQVTFLFILLLVIVIGNVAVLIAIGVSKSGRRSRMNFFIMNLAIADLSNAFFNVLTDTIWKITIYWYAGHVGCKVFRFLQASTQYAATFALVALSIDRLDAIARPLNFTGSGLRAKVLVGCAWCLSFLFSTPMIFLNNLEVMPDGFLNCWMYMPEQWQWQVYITLIALSLFIIPAVIIGVCYGIIIFIVWVKSRELLPKKKSKKSKGNGSILDHNDHTNHRISEDRTSSRGVIPQAKIRTVKMTLVIVIVFIICWAPYFLFDLIDVYGHIPRNKARQAASVFINSLAPLNSAANPIIYGIFSTRICRNLRKIKACDWLMQRFCCCCACMKTPLGQFTGTTRYSSTVVSDVSSTENPERRRSGARLSLEPSRRSQFDRDGSNAYGKEHHSLLQSLPEEGAKYKQMESVA